MIFQLTTSKLFNRERKADYLNILFFPLYLVAINSNDIYCENGIKMACSRHFHDAMEALNSYGDLMVQEGLEFIIGSSEGNSKLTIDLC